MRDTPDPARPLEELAWVAAAEGRPERAARLYGAAAALREARGVPLTPDERARHTPALAAARARLDEVAWAADWAAGRALSLEAAVAYALEEEAGARPPAAP